MNGDNDVVEVIAYNESGEIIAVGSESDVVAQACTNASIVQLNGARLALNAIEATISANNSSSADTELRICLWSTLLTTRVFQS